MKLAGLTRRIILLCTSSLLLGSFHMIRAFARETPRDPGGALSDPSGHRDLQPEPLSSSQLSRSFSTQLLSHSLHRHPRHHPRHNQRQIHRRYYQQQQQRQQQLTPAERSFNGKAQQPSGVSYQLYSKDPTLIQRRQGIYDVQGGGTPTNTHEKVKAFPSSLVDGVFPSPQGHEESRTYDVLTDLRASDEKDGLLERDGHSSQTEGSGHDTRREKPSESADPTDMFSFLDSFISWWSPKSSSNSSSSSSSSLSKTESLSSSPFADQPSLPGPSSSGQRHDTSEGLAKEMSLAAGAKDVGIGEKSDSYHGFQKTTRLRSVRLKEAKSHDIMLGDDPNSGPRKRRKARPKRRTRKKKRRGHRSTKKRKSNKRLHGNSRDESAKLPTANHAAGENVTEKVVVLEDITTSPNLADTDAGGFLAYEIKSTWNEKVDNSNADSTTRKTTISDIDTNVDEFSPSSTPSTSTLNLNDNQAPASPTNVRLVNDKDSQDVNNEDEEQVIVKQRNQKDYEQISQSGKASDKVDLNPTIDIHVRTHQQTRGRSRGDTPVVEEEDPTGSVKEESLNSMDKEPEKDDEYANENLSKAPGDSEEDALEKGGDTEKQMISEAQGTKGGRNDLDRVDVIPAAASHPGTGLFATVRELVMTVKDLYAQQELNRKGINDLFSRYRSQRTDLHLTEAKVSTLEQSLRSLSSTLQNLDVTAGGIRQEMNNFRNRQHRADRNQRRLRLETERLLGKVNRLDEEQDHLKALHDSNSGHMLVSSELTKTNAALERFSSRVARLERLDLKRSSRTNKLHKKLGSLEDGLNMAQTNLKDVASDVTDCSDQIGSLRMDLDDLIDNMEVSTNPEFLEALKGLGLNANGIAGDGEGTLSSPYGNAGEYSGEGTSSDDEDGIKTHHDIESLQDGIQITTKSSRDHEQAKSGNGSGMPNSASIDGKNKLRKSRHLDSTSSGSKDNAGSWPQMEVTTSSASYKRHHRNIKSSPPLDSSDTQSSLLEMTTSPFTNTHTTTVFEEGGKEGNHSQLYDTTVITKAFQQQEHTDSSWPTQQPTAYGSSFYSHASPHDGNVINERGQRFTTSFGSGSDLHSATGLKPTSRLVDSNENTRISTSKGKGPTNTDQISAGATDSPIQPTSVVSPIQASTTNGDGDTFSARTAPVLHTSRDAVASVNLQTSHNRLESNSWLRSTPTYNAAPQQQATRFSSESSSSHHVSQNHYVEHRSFSWNNTILGHYIRKLEQRIRILESSLVKLTSSTMPGLREELSKALSNYTVSVTEELLRHKSDAANRTALLREEIEKNFNRSTTLEERFTKREMDLHRLKTITGQTSIMITDLANQVSAINMSEFISRLQFSLANFTRSVLTLDQWKLASDLIINTTADHEAKISHLAEAIKSTTQRSTKLADRIAASQASSRRWYRTLQGHVIQLNNTVQDFKDRMEQRVQKEARGTASSSQPSMELQSKMDSLHIQLLYNSNRLSGLETSMLNKSLEQCRRATSELEQQSSIVRHEQEQKVLRNELGLLQEKVQRIDLSVYRMHTGIKTSDAVMSRLTSDVRHLKPVSSQVIRLEKEVSNLLHQVPRDCQAYYSRGYRASGVYIIYPKQVGRSIRVYCVMEEHAERPNAKLLTGSNKILASSTPNDQKSPGTGKKKETLIINDGGDDTASDAGSEMKESKKRKRRRTRKKRKDKKGGDGPEQKTSHENDETEFEDFLRADEESTDDVLSKEEVDDEDGQLFLDPLESRPTESDLYNGGWTVIQRRYTGSVNFTRSWLEYAMGFGRAADEYWLGNDVIHLLTNQDSYECRILMTDVFDGVWEARYDHFRMGSQAEDYRLQVSGYHGNASDGLGSANHMSFSTLDRDNDASSSHCALYGRGGWWYRHCHISNLNGPFDVGLVWFNRAWRDWVQMKTSLIMVKPRSGKNKASFN